MICPASIKENLAKVAALVVTLWTSRKLWMTLMGVSIMWGIYWHTAYWDTKLADSLPPDKLTILLPLLNEKFQTMMWGVVTAVGMYLGFSTLDKFTRGTTSVANIASNMISEIKTSKEEIIYREELERGD